MERESEIEIERERDRWRERVRERGFKNVHTNVRQQRNSPGREDGD